MIKHLFLALALSLGGILQAQDRIDSINNELIEKSPTAKAFLVATLKTNAIYIIKEGKIFNKNVLGQCVVMSDGVIEITIDVFNCFKARQDPRIVLGHELCHLFEAATTPDWKHIAKAHAFALAYNNRPEELSAFRAQKIIQAEIEAYEKAHKR